MARYTINFGDGTIKETDNLGDKFEHKYTDGLEKHTVTVRGECGFNATLTEVQTTHTLDVTCDTTMGSVSGSGTYDEGSQVEVRCTPNSCHRFAQWSDGNTTNPRTINVDSDISLRAIMEIKTYTVKLSGSNCTFTGAGTYDCGKSVTISAKPADGYRFVQWNDGDTNPKKTFVIAKNHTYTATCEKVETGVCLPTNTHSYTAKNIGVFEANSSCNGVYISMPQSSKWTYNHFTVDITKDGNLIGVPIFWTKTDQYIDVGEKRTSTSSLFTKSATLTHVASSSEIKQIYPEDPASQPHIFIYLMDRNDNVIDSRIIVNNTKSLESFNKNGADLTLEIKPGCVAISIKFESVTFDPTNFTLDIKKTD